jgi:hypothetical protein
MNNRIRRAMRRRVLRSIPGFLWIVALASASSLFAASRADTVEEFQAFLLPDTIRTGPDSLVSVRFEVDSTAHSFNGYRITVEYDPAIVAFITEAEGHLMVDRCPERFTRIAMSDSSITYSHSVLCDGLSLDGPGVLSVFTFRALALGMSHLRITSDPDRSFCDGGLYIWPGHPTYPRQVILHDAVILVLDPASDAPDGGGQMIGSPAVCAGPTRIEWVQPNPFQARSEIRFQVGAAGLLDLSIFDVMGRHVRTIVDGTIGPGPHVEVWDGLRQDGRSAASGRYYCVLRAGSRMDRVPLVLAR